MKVTPARISLTLLAAFLVPTLAACKLPAQVIQKLAGARSTPAPTVVSLVAKETRGEVVQVADDRASGEGTPSTFEILVRLPDLLEADIVAARVVVKKAVDDLGTNLVPDEAPPATLVEGAGASGGVFVRLKNAPRKAKLLRELALEIDLDASMPDPAYLVTIPAFRPGAGRPIVNPVLQAAGIEIVVLTPELLGVEKKAVAEAKRVEAVKGGADAASAQQEFDAALDRFILIDDHDTVLKVKDPNKRISYYSFLEADGTVTPAQLHDETGLVVLSPQGLFTSDDTSLRIHTKAPRTLTRWAILLKDVPLP